ncbi:MAG: sigma-70 family RNA polymerase sigma factor [Planctomycetota bacterium]
MNWDAVIELLYVFEKVQGYLRRRYPSLTNEDIEDCIQESMVIAARKLGDGTILQKGNAASYCFGIILKTARKHLAKKRGTQRQPAEPDAPAGTDPLLKLIQKQQIEKVFAHCSPDERAILRLIYWEDLTQQEVGAMWDVSKSTISRRLNRTLDLLEGLVG